MCSAGGEFEDEPAVDLQSGCTIRGVINPGADATMMVTAQRRDCGEERI
jgi:hypothetical protein